ncbi:unnamed protein product [Schistosoma margrebowiei]|uniref:Secreted protein n=1 Tax=Schistosoma margrebowiei TaxID=48269 RepID=A0A3P8D9I8_9TREM|nr:unnamed protein product [Schistosoma margrebowiei]
MSQKPIICSFLSTLYLVAFQSFEALKSVIRTYERATYCRYVVRDSHFHRDRKSYIRFVCCRNGRRTPSSSSQPSRRTR